MNQPKVNKTSTNTKELQNHPRVTNKNKALVELQSTLSQPLMLPRKQRLKKKETFFYHA